MNKSVDECLAHAIEAHSQGRWADAQAWYLQVLGLIPDQPDALHNLGVLAAQQGLMAESLPWFKRAVAAHPQHPQYWLSLIRALYHAKDYSGARKALGDAGTNGCRGSAFDELSARLPADHPPARPSASVAGVDAIVAHLDRGEYGEMLRAAQAVTRARAADPAAWYYLGIALVLVGRSAEAEQPFRQTLRLAPKFAEAHANLGRVLLDTGRAELAIPVLRRSLELKPGVPEALNNLALALLDVGQLSVAQSALQEAIRHQPEFVQTHNNLGLVLAASGQLEAAEASFRRAIELQPLFPEAHFNLGSTLATREAFADAEVSLRRAMELRPDYTDAWYYLGKVLVRQDRLAEAVDVFARTVELQPGHVEAMVQLGLAYLNLDQSANAIPVLRGAVVLAPDNFDAQANLGKAMMEVRSYGHDTVAQLRLALTLNHEAPLVHAFLGSSLEVLGQHDAALASFRTALTLDPFLRSAFGSMLFTLNYHPDKGEEEIYEAYREYDKRYGEPQKENWKPHLNNRESGRRLKVGYVSPDFNTHAVGKFLEPLLSGHNKAEVEIYGYAELRREDEATERYKRYVDHWIPTRGLSHDELAERIRQDGIDILVDVAGHTSRNRLQVFAKKPAPVSVSWLGFGYTTGLKAIDYFLTDGTSVPEGTEHLYAEKPWRLEGSAYVYRPAAGMGEVSPLPALEQGHITFGTLTRAVRINHRVIRVWSEILKRVAGSKLVIDSANYQDGKLCEELVEKFAAEGIEPERLDIGYHSPPWDVLRGMDIGLDCFPHNSGTTLFESLYMGIPYVTLAGRTSPRRLGSSILKGVGHPEWITETEAAYIEKVVDLAGDKERLAAIRGRLREEMEAGPLRDEAGFVQRVEQAYRHMFKNWAETQT